MYFFHEFEKTEWNKNLPIDGKIGPKVDHLLPDPCVLLGEGEESSGKEVDQVVSVSDTFERKNKSEENKSKIARLFTGQSEFVLR